MNAKMLLEDHTLIIELLTPAYNIHGVEAAPNIRTPEEKELVKVAKRKLLESFQQLLAFTPSHTCTMKFLGYRLENIEDGTLQAQPEHIKWHHFNVRAELIFTCEETLPEKIAFTNLFNDFPRLKEIDIQFIANNSDLRRATLSPEKSVIPITRSSEINIKN